MIQFVSVCTETIKLGEDPSEIFSVNCTHSVNQIPLAKNIFG